MGQTFQQLQKQIEALQAKAEEIRRSEYKEVVAKIKVAIDAYGISKQDLFGSGAQNASSKQNRSTTKSSNAAKYSDGSGNTWVGRGKRPQWLRDALAAGGRLEDFLGQAGPASAAPGNAAAGAGRKRQQAKGGGKAKYRDDAGHVWSGRGPRPRWLKDALAAGRTMEELQA